MASENPNKSDDNSVPRIRVNKWVVYGAIAVVALIVSFILRRVDLELLLDFPLDIEYPVKTSMNNGLDWLVINGAWFFDGISYQIKVWLGRLKDFLIWLQVLNSSREAGRPLILLQTGVGWSINNPEGTEVYHRKINVDFTE